jgi:hypothetical protein
MARILTKLRIDEVSSVDRGAGEGVRVVLMKRHDDTPHRETLRQIFGCACRKSNPGILVVQSTQDRTAKNVSSASRDLRPRNPDGVHTGRFLDHPALTIAAQLLDW